MFTKIGGYMDGLLNKTVTHPQNGEIFGTGWIPPVPDLRNYVEDHTEIRQMTRKLQIPRKLTALPTLVDLRQWCSPIENQLQLGSCTANAAVGIVEYFERHAFNKYLDGSRLFVYKTTRNLMGLVGDTGAGIAQTMAALVLCGVPEEKFWPYTDKYEPGVAQNRYFDLEPSAFVYALADNYEAIRYFSHDPMGANILPVDVLANVKKYIAAQIPAMFGFYGFSSFSDSDVLGGIPFPGPNEAAQWGHAVVAVGYDDNKVIKNTKYNTSTTGALLIRNSWGTGWGDKGYGWLPYEYVLRRLAKDFWSLLTNEWVDSLQFGFPATMADAVHQAFVEAEQMEMAHN